MSTSEDSSDGDVAPKGAKGINKPPPKHTSTPVLSPGRLKLYEKRYDENYDLPGDLSYYKWVKENQSSDKVRDEVKHSTGVPWNILVTKPFLEHMHKERTIGEDGKSHTVSRLPDTEELDATHHNQGDMESIRHDDPLKYKRMMEQAIPEAEQMYHRSGAHIDPPRNGKPDPHGLEYDEPDMPDTYPQQPYAGIKGLFLAHGTNFK